jgi:hypothetical protein
MSDAGPNRTHRLRPNHREWTPPQVMFLDAETTRELGDAGELHTLRLWAARLVVRRTKHGGGLGASNGWGYDTAELADQIDIWTEGQRTLWAYAHNLSFDLAVTRLPAELAARGWVVTAHAVSSDAPWLRMRRGQCVLTVCDSWGWLRAELAAIGADIGAPKLALPDWNDPDSEWLARCEGDVDILARAMCDLMDWWDAEQLGSWTLTGSAGGWNTWRHRTTAALPLIVPDAEQTAADRKAIYGGRREAFRHGTLDGGPWVLLDFKSAYPSIAAAKPLPAARQGNFDSLPLDSALVCGQDYGIIAQADVHTTVPRYPVRVAGRVVYPVGTFRTTLAGPEIAEARTRGELIAIGPGYLHKLSPHMAEWASWVLRVTDDASSQIPRVCRRAVKHWGRAVIGKTAAKGWQTRPLETLGWTGWDYRPAWNAELQAPSHLIDICGVAAEVISTGDGDNAYPAILAWVESWVRVYLGRAIDDIGPEHVITCDTDGLIMDNTGRYTIDDFPLTMGPLTMRPKAKYDEIRVIGPQHIITPGDRKLSGIPSSAVPNDDGELQALLWPKLASQMAMRPGGTEPGYLRPWARYTLPASTVAGYVTRTGAVQPLRAVICHDGGTHVLAALETAQGDYPPELQSRHLAELITAPPEEGQPCSHHSFKSNGTTGVFRRSGQMTSAVSSPNRTPPAAAKHGKWNGSGAATRRTARRALSGLTRILSPTRTTKRKCIKP